MIPDDFICPWHVETFFDDEARFMVPVMDEVFARDILRICTMHTRSVRMGGIYVQTIGPRLETRAEIKMLKRFGDIVGMTLASEATLAMELEMPYASICSVDNYCHGIHTVPLTMDEILANVAEQCPDHRKHTHRVHRSGPPREYPDQKTFSLRRPSPIYSSRTVLYAK